jgi:isoquinoline 1-oxidoreductase subunit alpha
MASLTIHVNNTPYTVDVEPDTPLLWVLRDHLELTGTKYSCGIGLCGSCTVHINEKAVRSCQVPVSSVANKQIRTIEGLSQSGDHPLQRAWISENVSQCGYCQPGQIMTAAALLEANPHPSDEEIVEAMSGILCRCGTYSRIIKAIRLAAEGAA